VITDGEKSQFEATVWNATDLKNFPVKIQHTPPQGQETTMVFRDIKLSKPDAKLFEPPSDFKKYAGVQELMQQEMMKRMGMPGGAPGGMAAPPAARPNK